MRKFNLGYALEAYREEPTNTFVGDELGELVCVGISQAVESHHMTMEAYFPKNRISASIESHLPQIALESIGESIKAFISRILNWIKNLFTGSGKTASNFSSATATQQQKAEEVDKFCKEATSELKHTLNEFSKKQDENQEILDELEKTIENEMEKMGTTYETITPKLLMDASKEKTKDLKDLLAETGIPESLRTVSRGAVFGLSKNHYLRPVDAKKCFDIYRDSLKKLNGLADAVSKSDGNSNLTDIITAGSVLRTFEDLIFAFDLSWDSLELTTGDRRITEIRTSRNAGKEAGLMKEYVGFLRLPLREDADAIATRLEKIFNATRSNNASKIIGRGIEEWLNLMAKNEKAIENDIKKFCSKVEALGKEDSTGAKKEAIMNLLSVAGSVSQVIAIHKEAVNTASKAHVKCSSVALNHSLATLRI